MPGSEPYLATAVGSFRMELDTIAVTDNNGVRVAVLDNPPVNLIDRQLFRDLMALTMATADDPSVKVLILRSANPDFFIAHFDVSLILQMPTEGEPEPLTELHGFHTMVETLRTMPAITIAELRGRVGGGGAEVAASCDLRYGDDTLRVNQPEVALGILPGGSGTVRWAQLTNRSRAIETIVGCDDIDAPTAAAWGWLTRHLPPTELSPFVDRLAGRIAGYPSQAIARAIASIDHTLGDPTPHLLNEALLFEQTLRGDDTPQRMQNFLDRGGQTFEGESRLNELADELG